MNVGRISGFATLVFAAAGAAGFWEGAPAVLLLPGFLLLPGAAVVFALGDRECEPRGPGRLAHAAGASLVLLVPAVLPAFVLGAPLSSTTNPLAAVYAAAGLAALIYARHGEARPGRRVWWAFAISGAVLVPTIVHYAGGTVDDWWDLAFIRGYLDSPLAFAEPVLGTGRVHPRFAWNSWLVLQALVSMYSTDAPAALLAPALAVITCVLGLAAVDALAGAVLGYERTKARCAALLFAPVWLWGTEAIPYFTRLYQDKFFAGFVLAPSMIAAALLVLRLTTARRLALFALAVAATVTVHGVVFAVALLGCAAAVVGFILETKSAGAYTDLRVRLRRNGRSVNALAVVACVACAYPFWQAVTLHYRFAGQGISLSSPDNPVVRAHLALGRLVGAFGDAYVVNPAAVFGSIAWVAAVGVVIAFRGRRRGDRILVCLTLLPAALIFVPFVTGALGYFFVPWMLYRIGWIVPVAILAARAFEGSSELRNRAFRFAALGFLTVVSLALAFPDAADRIARDMREHPGAREAAPRGTTLELYERLRALPGHAPVLAPPGLSNLIPALAGKPVVALSERGTVVFSSNEREAYSRLRDSAEFYSATATAESRARIARAYGSDYAVFRRRYITAGSDARWMERGTAEGFLLSHAELGTPTWSEDRRALRSAIPETWNILAQNADFFLVEIAEGDSGRSDAGNRPSNFGAGAARSDGWLRAAGVDAGSGAPAAQANHEVLASLAGYPGAGYVVEPSPLGFGISEKLVWTRGNAVWEDGPDRAVFDIRFPAPCDVTAISVVPYLGENVREAFEIRLPEVSGVGTTRRRARDFEAIVVDLGRVRTDALRVEVRSLIGSTFGIADVQVFGDRSSCEGGWRPMLRARLQHALPRIEQLLALATRYPNSQRAAIGIVAAREDDAPSDARAVLRTLLGRETTGAAAWIELGLLQEAAGDREEALRSYRRARAADSNSAWAHGCLAWAALQRGNTFRSAFEAWRAVRLDWRYADAYTMLGVNAARLGAERAADRFLRRAMHLDPRRSWAFLVAAGRLEDSGRREEAERLVRKFLARVPDDVDARRLLAQLGREPDARDEG